jgi:hypothetical protein
MKIRDGETVHELSDALVDDILKTIAERLGVRVESPLFVTLTPSLELGIEETARALFEEGFCSFDWHRRVFTPVVGGGICTFCEHEEAEHERLPVCPEDLQQTDAESERNEQG